MLKRNKYWLLIFIRLLLLPACEPAPFPDATEEFIESPFPTKLPATEPSVLTDLPVEEDGQDAAPSIVLVGMEDTMVSLSQ